MTKFYFTFGQVHVHRYNNVTLDCDCVLEIEAENSDQARKRMFDTIGKKWAFQYEKMTPEDLKFFPRGIVRVPGVSSE